MSRASITGAVYLAYFLTALFAQSLVGRTAVAYSDAASLPPNAVYVAVTVLFYQLFTPVSRTLSLANGKHFSKAPVKRRRALL
jgi:hypothetical protein